MNTKAPDAVVLSGLRPFSFSSDAAKSANALHNTSTDAATEASVPISDADRADSRDEAGASPWQEDSPPDEDLEESSPWPRSAPDLAGLNHSTGTGFNLFARLREEKRSLVELGIITVDRRLEPANRGDTRRAEQSSTSLERDTVRQLRQALDQTANAREEALERLEALANDAANASVSRLLAEAYLRLGRPEEAAMRFREAVQQRSRA